MSPLSYTAVLAAKFCAGEDLVKKELVENTLAPLSKSERKISKAQSWTTTNRLVAKGVSLIL